MEPRTIVALMAVDRQNNKLLYLYRKLEKYSYEICLKRAREIDRQNLKDAKVLKMLNDIFGNVDTDSILIAEFEIDDLIAIEEGVGSVEFFESIIGRINGIDIRDARVLDEDDPEDADAWDALDRIFDF